MSSEAVAWAFKQQIKPSSLKFTLVAMAECANYQTGRIFASIAHLSEITSQDRKTLIANMAELEKRGLIADTGERTGSTKQVKVYRAVIGTVPETEPFQKRNSTVSGRKQSQKRDTEPSLEPSLPSETTSPQSERATAKGECETVVSDWNAMAAAHDLPACAKLSPTRRKACQARLRDDGLAAIQQAIQRVPGSSFLRGETGDWSGANIDFLLRPDTVTKILEGKYDDRNNRNGAGAGNVRAFSKPKDGAIAALDRRLGLDGGSFPQRPDDAGSGEGDCIRAATGPRRLFS